MSEINDELWRMAIALFGGMLVLLFGMFTYCVMVARAAHLGDKWIEAAGSRRRAVLALKAFTDETDALIVSSAYRWPTGALILNNRESIERANILADAQAERASGGRS